MISVASCRHAQTLLCAAMLCAAMLCAAMLCAAMLCAAMRPCCALPCDPGLRLVDECRSYASLSLTHTDPLAAARALADPAAFPGGIPPYPFPGMSTPHTLRRPSLSDFTADPAES